jgi:hypothetical protein
MKIRCLDKKDCFANADGYCICLTNNDFGELEASWQELNDTINHIRNN